MISRDFVLRQVHQLAQALALVLFQKRAGRTDEAEETLAAALRDATGLDLEGLWQADRAALLALCASGDALSPEKAVALADLLREDGSTAARERAAWLYEAARAAGGAVPFDVPAGWAAGLEPTG